MIKKLFRLLGFMPISEHTESIRYLSLEIEKLLVYKSRFDRPSAPIKLYDSFVPNRESKKSHWSQFWEAHCRNLYSAWTLNILSLHPDLIASFFQSFAAFDWKGTAQYMEKVNWFWEGNDCSPTVEDLQMGVLDLLLTSIQGQRPGFDEETGCSSGGFEFSIIPDGVAYKVTIEFKK